MSEDADPYAKARTGLRDTAKWYTASLAALGATLAGGLSFGILPDLKGDLLVQGLVTGVVVFAVILAAIFLVQEILFPKPFDRDLLREAKHRKRLEGYLDNLLPGDVQTLDQLFQKEKSATTEDEKIRLRTALAGVTSFASFLDLQHKIRSTNCAILLLFVVACAGIAYLSYLHGIAKRGAGEAVAVAFAPGAGWSGFAAAISAVCPGDAVIMAEAKADTPFDGWWSVTLKEPEACAGASFSVPNAVVRAGAE